MNDSSRGRNPGRRIVAPQRVTAASVPRRPGDSGQAVKSGAGQDRAGCSRTGLPDSDALEHLEGPGEQVASSRGGFHPPRTPPAGGQS